ncbi:MAG: ADP-forming succinate--CoA ligase subunit beta [Gammaproteobacteria bacterium]|nr:ADP-forming succinate--CoA ligase subunit beta [Gammaproteobacteria bacterium]
MNLHEYQSKDLFKAYGIPCPEGRVVSSAADAVAHARTADSFDWVVKAQIHAGGRGKAGGVQMVHDREGLELAVSGLVGSRLVTGQGGGAGHPVNQVLLEPVTAIARELYLSLLVDREAERIAIIASAAGGMDIEAVAADTPERIIKVLVDPAVGLQPYQGRRVAFALGLETGQVKPFLGLLGGLYRLFTERDLSLVEINPLVVTADGELLALDAKINVDDNALARHPDLARLYDTTQEDPRETRAKAFDLNYIALDGNIACMVNGAGLAMATMDLIKLEGGEPANFLDVGGGTTAERVTEAFKIILADDKAKAILVNIFGGIVRCDLIAEGIIEAVQDTGITLPVVVRLEGTNVEQGLAMLATSGLDLIGAEDLADAARRVVAAAEV